MSLILLFYSSLFNLKKTKKKTCLTPFSNVYSFISFLFLLFILFILPLRQPEPKTRPLQTVRSFMAPSHLFTSHVIYFHHFLPLSCVCLSLSPLRSAFLTRSISPRPLWSFTYPRSASFMHTYIIHPPGLGLLVFLFFRLTFLTFVPLT